VVALENLWLFHGRTLWGEGQVLMDVVFDYFYNNEKFIWGITITHGGVPGAGNTFESLLPV
jgi:hypothetical protein